ncbi:helix-turn-helix domain-containing protein [Acidothermaceae bacterium B102]|nr:helix-turn-helix domain-containing protein [Acidothermaceae bacterium B102]
MSLGSELAAAREAHGLSVDDVAASTRIRATLIRAIEDDDFAPCGGAVYARGHIRSIARAVGLDPEPLLATFAPPEAAAAPPPLPGGLPGGELLEKEHEFARKTRPQGARWGSVMAAALVVIIGLTGFSIYENSGKNSATTPNAAVHTTTPAVTTTPSASAAASPSAAATSAAAATTSATLPPVAPSSEVALAHQSGVTLRLNVTGDRSWFHVASSTGATLFEGILAKGATKDFADPKQIRLIVGAPSAVDLVVNGTDIGSLPETGKAVGHVVFTPTSGKTAHG